MFESVAHLALAFGAGSVLLYLAHPLPGFSIDSVSFFPFKTNSLISIIKKSL
jgi:hypothetical protein